MILKTRTALVAILSLALTGCPAPRKTAAPQPRIPVAPGPLQPVSGAERYLIVPGESLVRILVYRGGTLATAGHNHIIASHDVTGVIYRHPDLEKSAFELKFPVSTLAVDEPDLRAQEGADFTPQVSQSARDGTRKNMLGEALLNAAGYPQVRVISTGLKGSGERIAIAMRIGVKDQWRDLIAPITLQQTDNRLTAKGELVLRQSDLGLIPFSALMGALQVQDLMRIKFSIVASK